MMKTLLAALTLFVATTLPAKAADATIMVMWAEWCTPCKILDPVLDSTVKDYDNVEILRLDFTDLSFENIKAQVTRAEAIKAEDYVPIVGLKTGYGLIIVDGENRGRVSAGMTADIIKLSLDNALAQDIPIAP